MELSQVNCQALNNHEHVRSSSHMKGTIQGEKSQHKVIPYYNCKFTLERKNSLMHHHRRMSTQAAEL